MEILLTDKTWLEGKGSEGITSITERGVYLDDVYRSQEGHAETLPLAKRVFVPYNAILFIILES